MILTRLEQPPSVKCTQYVLLAFAAVFTLIGLVLGSIGDGMKKKDCQLTEFLDTRFYSPRLVLLMLGCSALPLGFFGCWAAKTLNIKWLRRFSFILGTALFLEVAVSLLCYIMRDAIGDLAKTSINDTMRFYDSDPISRKGIDSMQYELFCCGLQGPDDWSSVDKWSYKEPEYGIGSYQRIDERSLYIKTIDGKIIPQSCCFRSDSNVCVGVKDMGCVSQFQTFFNRYGYLWALPVYIFGFIQLMCVVFAYKLVYQLSRQNSQMQHYRWLMSDEFAYNLACKLSEYESERDHFQQVIKEDTNNSGNVGFFKRSILNTYSTLPIEAANFPASKGLP